MSVDKIKETLNTMGNAYSGAKEVTDQEEKMN